jgi:hypothetical protein
VSVCSGVSEGVGVKVRVGGNHCVGVLGKPVGLGPGVKLAVGEAGGVVGSGVSPGAGVVEFVKVGTEVMVGWSSDASLGAKTSAATPKQ